MLNEPLLHFYRKSLHSKEVIVLQKYRKLFIKLIADTYKKYKKNKKNSI